MTVLPTPSRRVLRRAATSLSAVAVAGGLLVAGPTAGAAQAAAPAADRAQDTPTSLGYRCTGPFGTVRATLSLDTMPQLDGLPTGLPLTGGIAVDVELAMPVSLFGGFLDGILGGILGGGLGGGGVAGEVSDLTLGFGEEDLPIDDVEGDVEEPGSDPVLDEPSATDPFELPDPGEYDISLPDTFDFSAFSLFGIDLFSMECSMIGNDPVVDEVEVDEQESETDAGVDPGTVPVVEADVVRELGGKARGLVVAQVGNKIVGRARLDDGVARIPVRGLDAGRTKVWVRYLGNGTTAPSGDTVMVKRARG